MGISKVYVTEILNHYPAHGLPCSQANILITHSGRACLAGFGSSLLTMAADQPNDLSSWTGGGTIRWMSPELIYPESFNLGKKVHQTKESDVYALGMVVYEVLSGREPYGDVLNPTVIIWKVLRGERPERPQGDEGKRFTDAVWTLLELCWRSQPSGRPSAKAVLLCLEGGSPLSRPSSDVGGGGEIDTHSRSDATSRTSSASSPFRPGLAFIHPCGS